MEKTFNGKVYGTALSRHIVTCFLECAHDGDVGTKGDPYIIPGLRRGLASDNIFEALYFSPGGHYFLHITKHRFLGFGFVEDIVPLSRDEAITWTKTNSLYYPCLCNNEFTDTADDNEMAKALILGFSFSWGFLLRGQTSFDTLCRLDVIAANRLHFLQMHNRPSLSGVYAYSRWGKPTKKEEYGRPHNRLLSNISMIRDSGILSPKEAFSYAKKNGILTECVKKGHFGDIAPIG